MNANDKTATAKDEHFLSDLRALMNMTEDGGEPTDYELRFDYVEADTYDDQPEAFYRCALSCEEPANELHYFVGQDFSCTRVELWEMKRGLGAYLVRHVRDADLAAVMWNSVQQQFRRN